jgi:hypothetical protein
LEFVNEVNEASPLGVNAPLLKLSLLELAVLSIAIGLFKIDSFLLTTGGEASR